MAVVEGWRAFFFLGALFFGMLDRIYAETIQDFPSVIETTVTNVSQLRQLAAGETFSGCSVRLDGVVLWVSPAKDQMVFQDDSGGMMLKMDLSDQPAVRVKQRLVIAGSYLAGHEEITTSALIDNDGIHAALEKSDMVFLSAGVHPISVDWFNAPADFELQVDCAGPGMPRQHVPSALLLHPETGLTNNTDRLVSGLNYRCYEGQWDRLPDFSKLPVLRQGSTTNFDLQVRTTDTNVALTFQGYFNAPQSGEYKFWLKSDDGSKLYIGDRSFRLNVSGKAGWPQPRSIAPGLFVPEGRDSLWSTVEGTVTRVSEIYGGIIIEVSSSSGHTYLKLAAGNYNGLGRLLHIRVKAAGVFQSAEALDRQPVPTLLVPDINEITIVDMAPSHWADFPVRRIDALEGTNFPEAAGILVHILGTVGTNTLDKWPVIGDDTGQIDLETTGELPRTGKLVEVLGWWNRDGDEVRLRGVFFREIAQGTNNNLLELPLLTKAIQVKSLDRSSAQRGYPVRIQGVITARVANSFVIQDSTWSVFCYWDNWNPELRPKIGEFWEVEGISRVDFAPDVIAQKITYLRPGLLPEPIRPSRDELINGSLDTQYIEIQGIATIAETNNLILLTHEGRLRLRLDNLKSDALNRMEGALVRVRGVSSPTRDTNQMILPMLSSLSLFNASVSVDEPAPANPFEIPTKHASDLLFFDARADVLRRVKLAGQVLSESQGEYFLVDGSHGFRFEPNFPVKLHVGDLAEVVGFPDLNGPSPVLREAAVRVTGKTSLPLARKLSDDSMLSSKLDATLVSIEARLVSLSAGRSEQTLELQAGTRNFVARLANSRGTLPDILPGSLLELSGVYAGLGGDRASSREVDSFELLINYPADVRVLARPSWWTFRHTLAVIGGMIFMIVAALVWITLLHRQVEERSRQLTSEIKSREKAEHQRALEAERVRIARDLHDDLGATLTEIRFLSAVKSRDALVPEATRAQLTEVSEKSRQMVSSLDELVWAVNPANDTLPSLASYLRFVVEEFFRATDIRCRLDIEASLPAIVLTSEMRHNLYLTVREALNNIAKHSKATEALLRIYWRDQSLHIEVEDNGSGFVAQDSASLRSGLSNMHSRLEKIGGSFACDTRPNSGTVCRIQLPLDN